MRGNTVAAIYDLHLKVLLLMGLIDSMELVAKLSINYYDYMRYIPMESVTLETINEFKLNSLLGFKV